MLKESQRRAHSYRSNRLHLTLVGPDYGVLNWLDSGSNGELTSLSFCWVYTLEAKRVSFLASS